MMILRLPTQQLIERTMRLHKVFLVLCFALLSVSLVLAIYQRPVSSLFAFVAFSNNKRHCNPAILVVASLSDPTQQQQIIKRWNIMVSRPALVALKSVWKVATLLGMRRLSNLLKRWYPSAYQDTIFYVDDAPDGCVALTIDDGLSRGGSETCMVQDLVAMLQKYNAHATFFVCSDYMTTPQDVQVLMEHGHELGNHLTRDVSGYYSKLSSNDFTSELKQCNRILKEEFGYSCPLRWFRAPQGLMTATMAKAVRDEGMQSVLGDCYCDDWAFGEAKHSGSSTSVPVLMLRQAHVAGSIAIFHMPERGFRASCLQMIEKFVQDAQVKGLKCVTLSELKGISAMNE